MERDFLGLNSKDSSVVVKEEVVEGCKDSGPGFQWPSSSNISALPHFMSFKTAKEEKTTKSMSNQHPYSGFVNISTSAASGDKQKNGHDGTPSMKAHTVEHNVLLNNLSHDLKKLPAANQQISVSISNPFFHTHFASAPQNSSGATLKQQLYGGIPVAAPHSILPSLGSVSETTKARFNSKSSSGQAPLTIFYAGLVKVYDDISPEKAQAIMLLAQSESTSVSNKAQQRAQVQVPVFKPGGGDRVLINYPTNAQASPGLSSRISVSSHPAGSTANDEMMEAKPRGVSSNLVNKVDPPKILTPLGPRSATPEIPSAPQAPKASLARFLARRKERIMNSAPYNVGKQSPECGSPGPNSEN